MFHGFMMIILIFTNQVCSLNL
uniref:Uncharacterized protein n=1 Tax=Rhizophora mucronata TaxID=61149 RepID=A0A2P2IN07_RHIMU